MAGRGEGWTGNQDYAAMGNTENPAQSAQGSTHESACIFDAICPARGVGAALVLPRCNTQAMQWHLDEISFQVTPGAHAILIVDRAGWHTTDKLITPPNITLMPLPPRSPELLLRLEPAYRSTLEDHVYRQAAMGTWVLINAGWYYS